MKDESNLFFYQIIENIMCILNYHFSIYFFHSHHYKLSLLHNNLMINIKLLIHNYKFQTSNKLILILIKESVTILY